MNSRRGYSYEETLHVFINEIKNLQSTFHIKLRVNIKMISLTDEQKIFMIKELILNGIKKNFNDDYFYNKCYEKLAPAETERSDNHEIKYHKKKCFFRNR